MALDNLTMALNGRVPLPEFAVAVWNFELLVRGLSDEIAKPAKIGWSLCGLEGAIEDNVVSSAVVTSIGTSRQPDAVERVVRAYGHVGRSLEQGIAIPYSDKVVTPAQKITGVLNGAVTSVRFETPEEDATIRAAGVASLQRAAKLIAHGAVEGVVQTLSRRTGLRFTLYDIHFDRAVSCYLSEGQEEMMRHAWGHRVIVEGRISRDPDAGRPVAIRQISTVEPVSRGGNFEAARGVVRRLASMPLPEVLVRRLRDA